MNISSRIGELVQREQAYAPSKLSSLREIEQQVDTLSRKLARERRNNFIGEGSSPEPEPLEYLTKRIFTPSGWPTDPLYVRLELGCPENSKTPWRLNKLEKLLNHLAESPSSVDVLQTRKELSRDARVL